MAQAENEVEKEVAQKEVAEKEAEEEVAEKEKDVAEKEVEEDEAEKAVAEKEAGALPAYLATVRNARTYVNDWSVAAPFLFCAPNGGVAMVRRLRVGPVCCGSLRQS